MAAGTERGGAGLVEDVTQETTQEEAWDWAQQEHWVHLEALEQLNVELFQQQLAIQGQLVEYDMLPSVLAGMAGPEVVRLVGQKDDSGPSMGILELLVTMDGGSSCRKAMYQ
ncbi:hypothetical protein Y1Q_0002402 [Alligator mississippiensis]|uniref:Uncharacterized protein n=1 Tax=Alligator mississippiensis TaxID=8496 RepID=A0A151N6B0_ALLMI|nr:hypothetical protein Y1Q_0002402 [Alligator mississippiensis]